MRAWGVCQKREEGERSTGWEVYSGFGLIESDAARETALCESADLSDEELVELEGGVR